MDNSKIVINPDASWDGLYLEIHFSSPVLLDTQKEIEEKVLSWTQKGIEEGYGGGYMHDESGSVWSGYGQRYKIWLDMGSAEEEAFGVLEGMMSSYPVDQIKVGFED